MALKTPGRQTFAMNTSASANFCGRPGVTGQRRVHKPKQRNVMAQARSASSDFNQAFGEAKKQASNLAGEASDAAQDVYEHARDKAADLADSANDAARQTAGSLERAVRNTIETQPYTAVAIALGLGWLLGRTHRPF
jgi:ElaB/YqjD/DUF883 family membrane-anchored ribosome-binding protein